MFIRHDVTRYRGTQQISSGLFLVVFTHPTEVFARHGKRYERLVATIRRVKLEQCGHFMMGSCRIAGHAITLSGGFGNDGLPCDFTRKGTAEKPWTREEIARSFVPVPDDLAYAYWTSEGHNEVGPTATAWTAWGIRLPRDSNSRRNWKESYETPLKLGT